MSPSATAPSSLVTLEQIAQWTYGKSSFATISRIVTVQDSANWINQVENTDEAAGIYDGFFR